MNERDYLRLKRQFDDDYRQKLAALELIWQEVSGGKKPPKEPQDTSVSTAERGNSAAAVEDFVKQWVGEPFSAKQVEAWITQVKGLSANRTTIIHKLRRMVNDGQLNFVTKGSGKRASLYATPESLGVPPGIVVIQSSDPMPEPQPEMATQEQVDLLRTLLADNSVSANTFREEVMKQEYGVERLRDLTSAQIEHLITRYRLQLQEMPF